MLLAKGQNVRLEAAASWLPKYTEYAVAAAAVAILIAFGLAHRYGRISRPVATIGYVVGGALGTGGIALGIYRIITPGTIPVEELDRQPLEGWRATSPEYSPCKHEPGLPWGADNPPGQLPAMPWDVAGDL
jgi:hypothetical protein